jgi:hypothetical protein
MSLKISHLIKETKSLYYNFSTYERIFIQENSRKNKMLSNFNNDLNVGVVPIYIQISESVRKLYKIIYYRSMDKNLFDDNTHLLEIAVYNVVKENIGSRKFRDLKEEMISEVFLGDSYNLEIGLGVKKNFSFK